MLSELKARKKIFFGPTDSGLRTVNVLVTGSLLLLLAMSHASSGRAEQNPDQVFGNCTVGVFSGAVTADGRPMIWKNRDVANHDQRFIYYSPYTRDGIITFSFIGNCYLNDTTRIYMGANERGFAIMNSDSYNMGDSLWVGLDDGTLMRLALETCETLSEFESFLDSTNVSGRLDCWNFGCLDATGASAMYECANHWYRKYDPLDPADQPPGYIVRANYSLSGGSENLSGVDRFTRANDLILERLQTSPIDAYFVSTVLVRDLGNVYADPYPLPYNGTQLGGPPGYIFNFGCTINNRSTSSAVVIRGVRPGERAALTTIFAILGAPALSVAFPLWVESGAVPPCLSDPANPPVRALCVARIPRLYDNPDAGLFVNSHYLVDDDSGGVYSYTFPLEAWGMNESDSLVEIWAQDSPVPGMVIQEEFRIASEIYRGFQLETAALIGQPLEGPQLPGELSIFNYPNPFNRGTYIVYSGANPAYPVRLEIFDLLGRRVTELAGTGMSDGAVYWAGSGRRGDDLSSGIYFYSLVNGPRRLSGKMLLIK